MKPLTDGAVDRLRRAADLPDLSGTRYRLVRKLGQGGMGSIYCVADNVLDREVALKVMTLAHSDHESVDRLLHEARVIAQLEHPGIVPVHEAGILPDGRMFYTMKLVQGQRLDEHLKTLATVTERLRLFQRICEPVAFAHARGVLHRDLKPQNIMVGPFGEVLVMDWGLSKLLIDALPSIGPVEGSTLEAAQAGVVMGTPGFMSPEQARGETGVDRRSDVYSLGAILKFLLTGTFAIPRPLNAIVQKCFEQDPSNRYSSAEELALEIGRYLDGLAVSAYPERLLAKIWRWRARNQAWLLLIAAYLVMRTIFIFWRTR
jgi:serine/threonine protein kinase